jgi:hypothetical protein
MVEMGEPLSTRGDDHDHQPRHPGNKDGDPLRRLAAPAAALALTLGLAACGNSDEDETAAPTSTAATPTTVEEAAGDIEEYCEASLGLETSGEPDVDFESASEEEIAEASKQFAREEIKPLADDAVAAAPEELDADIAVLVAALDELIATGDFETAFGTPEATAAEDRLHAFDLANCGWGQDDITGTDYAFQGFEATYEPGPVSFEFANEGEELHQLVVFKKGEGVIESFQEILSGPEEAAMEKVTSVAGTFAEPGQEGAYAVADLEPGEYGVVCFIPVGTTPEAAAAAEESGEEPEGGPPHFIEGMFAEFTVE